MSDLSPLAGVERTSLLDKITDPVPASAAPNDALCGRD
jgi:hypothetical protein